MITYDSRQGVIVASSVRDFVMCSTVIEFWCRVGAILEISQNCQETINLDVIYRIEKRSGHDTQNMVKDQYHILRLCAKVCRGDLQLQLEWRDSARHIITNQVLSTTADYGMCCVVQHEDNILLNICFLRIMILWNAGVNW